MTTLVIGSGVQVTVKPGDTLVVVVKLVYTVPVPVTAKLWASLYIAPGRDYTIIEDIQLLAGTDNVWDGSISMPITDNVGLRNYTYHLLVELPDYSVSVQEDNAVICTGMTEGILQDIGDIGQLIGMLVLVMMMGMMMNIMTEPEGVVVGAKKEYEKAKEVAQPIVQIFR